jgi:hypothetical protein
VEPYLSPFFSVTELPGVPVVSVVRSARAFSSLNELSQAWDDMNRALDRIGRTGRGLLMDVRQATGRNDAAFEQALARHRQEGRQGFARVAVLVGTPAGMLQVQRFASQDGVRTRVFLDAPQAIDWLSEPNEGSAQNQASPPRSSRVKSRLGQ